MTDWKSKLNRLDDHKLKDVFYNHDKYDYPGIVKDLAFDLLVARGFEPDYLETADFLQQERELDALLQALIVSNRRSHRLYWGFLIFSLIAVPVALSGDLVTALFILGVTVAIHGIFLRDTLELLSKLAANQKEELPWLALPIFYLQGFLVYPLMNRRIKIRLGRWLKVIFEKREEGLLDFKERLSL